MKKNPDAKPADESQTKARREFLHRAAKVAVTTPAAVALLLAAKNKTARAGCTISPIICPAEGQ